MNTLVISDTHLGRYNKRKDVFLKDLIEQYDRIIINGDFWDSWGTSLKRFVNSKYKELFDLLKSKETIYIYGNHDYRAQKDRELAEIFSDVQGFEYEITIGKEKFHFEHGHKFFEGGKNPLLISYYYLIDKIPFLRGLLYRLVTIIYKVFPNRVKKNKIGVKRNNYLKCNKSNDKYFVFSHTHIPEIDEFNKFVNTGCILGNFCSYAVIDAHGNIKVFEEEM